MTAAPTTPEAETLAAQAADLQQAIDELIAQKANVLDLLLTLHDLGKIDSKLQTTTGWTLQWSAGRQSYDYPADVIELEAQLQAAKEAAVAARRATPKALKPFWTVRKPRQATATSGAYWAGRNHAARAVA
jgi:hypothetical protein